MSYDEVEIPNHIIVPASFAGLIEWKDDGWVITEKGKQVVLDYVERMNAEDE